MIPTILKKLIFALTISIISFAICSFTNSASNTNNYKTTQISFPYAAAGLNKQQAASHLLNRFTFGATTQNIEDALKMGIENWLQQQLNTTLQSVEMDDKLKEYYALTLSNNEILEKFPDGNALRKMALKDGIVTEDQLKNIDKKEYKKLLDNYRDTKGLKPEQELYRQMINQKIIRANYNTNQVKEVLTDFWFNHFNVSMTKNQCRPFILNYERDAIRPNILGNFENLLLATAKSPAMLLYLDNFNSTGTNTTIENFQNKRNKNNGNDTLQKTKQKKSAGLNENYAREVMELHTLGVDGGYTQQDVTEAARVLTGWTINPIGKKGLPGNNAKLLDKLTDTQKEKLGVIIEGDFLFTPNRHDNGSKKVLGTTYNGEGYNEGVQLLKTLANHKSTATFISKKLATRFVSDNPSVSLVNKMAATFLKTKGNIKEVILTMVEAKEFWQKEALREKTKSPIEYVISSLRLINADITQPFQISNWVTKMGQQLYYYQAPTGFPDKAQYWINTGSLLNRMNFGLALASKRIPGVTFDLAVLNNNHEPESAHDALIQYTKILLPNRDVTTTIKRLTPLINDPTIGTKINDAAVKKSNVPVKIEDEDNNMKMMEEKPLKKAKKLMEPQTKNFGDNSMLAQVVGIIIGSPEFQRR